ncbi:Xenobiotic-transporting_ATPase / Multidrug resistance-associated protein [Hexamita inflata]|uniref:Xenobiotic-transporting ATPase / Multidrug resistance-associated protein n=1 Tax=Hexamita inflata TaxID=28002 RepID=A0AA86QSH0_9EUKA|nr:Xenobiotic-transporting ATPase / Multidrug resistance-associated protein [Hexamita inflata]
MSYIDSSNDWIMFSYMNSIIKKIKMQKYNQIPPISSKLQSKYSGKQIVVQMNHNLQNSLLRNILKTNSKFLWPLLIFIPLMSISKICSPITIIQFTKFLSPQNFFDCNYLFSEDPDIFHELNYMQGLTKMITALWGYLLLTFFAQVTYFVIYNISQSGMIRAATLSQSGLLDYYQITVIFLNFFQYSILLPKLLSASNGCGFRYNYIQFSYLKSNLESQLDYSGKIAKSNISIFQICSVGKILEFEGN